MFAPEVGQARHDVTAFWALLDLAEWRKRIVQRRHFLRQEGLAEVADEAVVLDIDIALQRNGEIGVERPERVHAQVGENRIRRRHVRKSLGEQRAELGGRGKAVVSFHEMRRVGAVVRKADTIADEADHARPTAAGRAERLDRAAQDFIRRCVPEGVGDLGDGHLAHVVDVEDHVGGQVVGVRVASVRAAAGAAPLEALGFKERDAKVLECVGLRFR